jgi:hypothetical protein
MKAGCKKGTNDFARFSVAVRVVAPLLLNSILPVGCAALRTLSQTNIALGSTELSSSAAGFRPFTINNDG